MQNHDNPGTSWTYAVFENMEKHASESHGKYSAEQLSIPVLELFWSRNSDWTSVTEVGTNLDSWEQLGTNGNLNKLEKLEHFNIWKFQALTTLENVTEKLKILGTSNTLSKLKKLEKLEKINKLEKWKQKYKLKIIIIIAFKQFKHLLPFDRNMLGKDNYNSPKNFCML